MHILMVLSKEAIHLLSHRPSKEHCFSKGKGIYLGINLQSEGGNRIGSILKAGLHLGPDWTLSYMPSIYGKDIPTGKPGPQKEEPQGSPLPKRIS